MTALTAIADDLTGACDVGAELAVAGLRARVIVRPEGRRTAASDAVPILNTQSRALAPRAAYTRVHDALRGRPAGIVLKKIDTALRGHLGAELDGTLDATAVPVAFVLAAIPTAGRITRGGCQWFGGRLLAETEFARDPEGPGAESSIVAVLARESQRRAAVIGRDVVTAGGLAAEVARARNEGVEVFVVDAESDVDVGAAVAQILALSHPVCVAGSIALAAALAQQFRPHATGATSPLSVSPGGLPLPALIVSGSLHSQARAQLAAVVEGGAAVAMPLPMDASEDGITRAAAAMHARLAAGISVVVAPPLVSTAPTDAALRATEGRLAALVTAIAAWGPLRSLVLIGGETSHAVLTRLGADTIDVEGRVSTLIARGTVGGGIAAGTTVVTKGGSGGEVDAIMRMLGNGASGVAAVRASS